MINIGTQISKFFTRDEFKLRDVEIIYVLVLEFTFQILLDNKLVQ